MQWRESLLHRPGATDVLALALPAYGLLSAVQTVRGGSVGDNHRKEMGRREFLQVGAAAGLGLAIGCRTPSRPLQHRYLVSGWTGNDPTLGHKLRDGKLVKKAPISKRHDVVVVGAGISGLTAAFKLRNLDTLVLEQAPRIGGNAKAEKRGAHEFNIGAAYFTDIDGAIGELWSELGLSLVPVVEPADRWLVRDKWVSNPWHDDAIAKTPNEIQRPMRAMKKAMQELLAGPDFPSTPYRSASPRALALDRISFAEWLKPYAQPELYSFIDTYCYSAFGGPASRLSAFGGLNFYSEFLGDIYAFPEGNAHVAKLLAKRFDEAGAGRVMPDCVVHTIEVVSDDLARVYFEHEGEPQAVEARRVVLAVPYFVAPYLLKDLTDTAKAKLGQGEYASYFVVNLCFDEVVSFEGYDSWFPGQTAFDDYIPSAWADRQRHQRLVDAGAGQVIACFACTRDADEGRQRMLDAQPKDIARPVVTAFEADCPGATSHLREAVVTRWGHAILINRPGMYTEWLPSIDKRIGSVFLAHSDGQGLPALESATQEAIAAAEGVLASWHKKTEQLSLPSPTSTTAAP